MFGSEGLVARSEGVGPYFPVDLDLSGLRFDVQLILVPEAW